MSMGRFARGGALSIVAVATACSSSPADAPADAGDAGDAEVSVAKIPAPTGDPGTWAVDKVGPYNVGHRTLEVTYRPPGQTADRTIPVDVFYPTLDAEGEHPKYLKIFTDADVFEEASVAPPPTSAGYPVHVYSHGSNGFGGTSSDMAHWFSSHGWVYVAPNHVGNVLGTGEGKRPVALYYLRSTDVTAALDAVEKLAAPDPLAGKLRTKRVLMSGHSFGTLTTWASSGAPFDVAAIKAKCAAGEFVAPCTDAELAVFEKGVADPRVVAGIPMAGGASDWFPTTAYDAPKKPMLLMTGSLDTSGKDVFARTTSNDLTWLEFEGGCHQLFALGGCPAFPEKDGWALTNTWAFAFGRRHVLGDASAKTTAIVTGTTALDPRIKFQHVGPTSPPGGP